MNHIKTKYTNLLSVVKDITGATEQMIKASRQYPYTYCRAMIVKELKKQGYTYGQIETVTIQKRSALIYQLKRLEDELESVAGKQVQGLCSEFQDILKTKDNNGA